MLLPCSAEAYMKHSIAAVCMMAWKALLGWTLACPGMSSLSHQAGTPPALLAPHWWGPCRSTTPALPESHLLVLDGLDVTAQPGAGVLTTRLEALHLRVALLLPPQVLHLGIHLGQTLLQCALQRMAVLLAALPQGLQALQATAY